LSYHEHNKLSRVQDVLAALAQGDVALVSDAGTPAINDPGWELVQAVIAVGFQVSPIPGPSAPIAALVASGLPTESFTYLGYLPRKRGERIALLEKRRNLDTTLIFLETPHRLVEALEDMLEVLGDRAACAAGDLTKLYEEVLRGPLSELLEHFRSHPPKGEFTLVVAGIVQEEKVWEEAQTLEAIRAGLALGTPARALAARIAELSGWSRNRLYQRILAAKRQADTI